MKKFTIELDVRLLILGAVLMIIGVLVSFTPKDHVQADSENGRYQAVSSERGFIILDTRTGQYILDSQVIYGKKMNWIKGDFTKSYQQGLDKTAD